MDLKEKNILVTGGCGFIGSHIVEELFERNSVKVVDNLSSGNINNLKPFLESVRFFEEDIRNKKNVYKIFKDIDIVFHEAANPFIEKSIKYPDYDFSVNVGGTMNILEACRKYDVERIVFASSSAIYGEPIYLPIDENHPKNPKSPYALGKLACEEYLKLYSEIYDIKYVILRYFNVYGERQDPASGVVSIFRNNFLANSPFLIYGNGNQIRDFVHVKDVVKANILVCSSKISNEVLNIGTGIGTSINDIVKIFRKNSDKKIEIIYKKERFGDIKESIANINKARKVLEFNPKISVKEWIKKISD